MADQDALQRAVEYGDPDAIAELQAARHCFQTALSQDGSNAAAMLALARYFLHPGLPESSTQSGMPLLYRAADAGLGDAQFELACRLRAADGSPAAQAEALRYLRLASDQDHAEADFLLGAVTLAGDVVPRDVPAARALLESAYRKGFPAAGVFLGALIAGGRELDGERSSRARRGAAGDDAPPRGGAALTEEERASARRYFEAAAAAGEDVAAGWLNAEAAPRGS